MRTAITLTVSLLTATFAFAVEDGTTFQAHAPYSPEIDIASDVVMVYGSHDLDQRIADWRAQGYIASYMTGISWGNYGSYYGSGDDLKIDEIQTTSNGELRMHGNSENVGYNVPSPAYIEFIKKHIEPAITNRVRAIFLEEPEFWANTGWSAAFKAEWERFYGEPWQAPDSSVDAQYRASKLKYELYFNALNDVMGHIDARAVELGVEIECHVPTHSLINYAHWGIVSPESHLIDIPALDGYIAQVWTGTARTPNMYRGVRKERTFDTAYFEYGQMWSMVRPTGKKVWFLHDPIEDNPNRSWNDYKRNYEATVIASLLWPGTSRFEVMPWPNRIFRGTYPKTDMDAKSDRQGIPADYATEILIVLNALSNMDQEEIVLDTGSTGIGVIVSDTLMFQRALPSPSDRDMGSFYGLALPLLKAGVPVEVVQLENVLQTDAMSPYDVLLLTYEGQKPLKPEYHDALSAWVRDGGNLVYVDDGKDPYHHVREWWNEDGNTKGTAYGDLFKRLGVKSNAAWQSVGDGAVLFANQSPAALAGQEEGHTKVLDWVQQGLERAGRKLQTKNYLVVRRGPYVIATVLDESVSEESLELEGSFIDLFSPALPVVESISLEPGQRGLYYDLTQAHDTSHPATVAAAGTRVREEAWNGQTLTFTTRGPSATTATARILFPREPKRVTTDPELAVTSAWDASSGTLHLTFPNRAKTVRFVVD